MADPLTAIRPSGTKFGFWLADHLTAFGSAMFDRLTKLLLEIYGTAIFTLSRSDSDGSVCKHDFVK